MSVEDPYHIDDASVLEPPVSLRSRFRHLGPSFILSASIVGSGELIATTTLGARAGFITFWVILISCLIKVMVQIEFARQTILTGKTAMQLIGNLPGWKLGRAKWSIWLVLVIMIVKLLQVGGIIGGVGIILNLTIPEVNVTIWVFLLAILVGMLVYQGYYKFIERFSMAMIAFFTLFTFASLYFLRFTDYAISLNQVLSGLTFQLPPELLVVAVGAFGITGVGADEILHYNYWCLEKGYARHSGPNDRSERWSQRAKGWMKVMYLDAVIAMIIYTIVTAAFYLLGAAVLYSRGQVPEGFQMIETLSLLYTESLGSGARSFFLIGSFIVLFSTLFAALAAWSRQYTDMFGQLKWIRFDDMKARNKTIGLMALVIPMLWALLFIFIELPVIMVLSGGIVGSVLLLLVCFAVLYFRYYKTPDYFENGLLYDVLLWISALTISGGGIYGLIRLFI